MPLFTAAIAVFTAVSTFIGALGTFGTFALQVAAGLGLNVLAKKIAGKPQQQKAPEAPGFSVSGKLQGGESTPRSFILGTRVTAGSLVYANTWGDTGSGETPNAKLTQVIALSDLPVQGLSGIWVNGQLCTISGTTDLPDYGYPVTEFADSGNNHLYVKFYDGTQTAADSFLTGTVASVDRPYESTRVGYGVAYVIVTCILTRKNERDFWQGFPQFKFEVQGCPLYDPSKDSSVGGSGSHRYDNPATWGGDGDDLPAVQLYNVLRGFSYDGEWLYGLQNMAGARLPVGNWIDQIEKCRDTVTGPDGSEATYRSCIEIAVSNPIADAVEALLTSCQGRLAEIGGFYKLHVGAPAVTVGDLEITDDDIISTEEQSFTPFFGLADTINGITAKYPSPEEGWNLKAAPPIYRADLEALARGRRLMADVTLDCVVYPRQVQQLMREALQEAQRARRHTFTLPPEYWVLEPNDFIPFTSERNGYEEKLFRVDGVVDKSNLHVIVDLTEVDPDDYDFDYAEHYEAPGIAPVGPIPVPAQAIVDFDVDAIEIEGDVPGVVRPGLLLSWSADSLADIDGIHFQVRRASDGVVIRDARCDEPLDGSCRIEGNGILASTEYEVRARYIPVSGRQVTWSSWLAVTTTDSLFGFLDIAFPVRDYLGEGIQQQIASLEEMAASLATSIANQTALLGARTQETRRIVSVENGDIRASVAEVSTAVATAEAALASLTTTVEAHADAIDELTGDVAANTASITTNATAISTLTSSLSSLTTTVSSHTSSISSLSASVTSQASAITTLQGYAAAQYAVTLDVNGYVTGFNLINAGASFSTATFVVDYFRVAKPGVSGGSPLTVFEVGTVSGSAAIVIKGNLLADGAVIARSIAAATITGDKMVVDTITAREIISGAATAMWSVSGSSVDLEDGTQFTTVVSLAIDAARGTYVAITFDTHLRNTGAAFAPASTNNAVLELWIDGACTISNASPGVVTYTAHGLSANQPVRFTTTGSLPTGLSTGTTYYVKTVLGADTFTVSSTPGGSAINTSSAGSGTHKCLARYSTRTIYANTYETDYTTDGFYVTAISETWGLVQQYSWSRQVSLSAAAHTAYIICTANDFNNFGGGGLVCTEPTLIIWESRR